MQPNNHILSLCAQVSQILVEMEVFLVLFMFHNRHAGITFKYSKMSFLIYTTIHIVLILVVH